MNNIYIEYCNFRLVSSYCKRVQIDNGMEAFMTCIRCVRKVQQSRRHSPKILKQDMLNAGNTGKPTFRRGTFGIASNDALSRLSKWTKYAIILTGSGARPGAMYRRHLPQSLGNTIAQIRFFQIIVKA